MWKQKKTLSLKNKLYMRPIENFGMHHYHLIHTISEFSKNEIGAVFPELKGKIDGMAIRVPTLNVSVVDLNFIASRETTTEEVNAILKTACEGPIGKILHYNEIPLVSIDFNHQAASSIFDATQTKVNGKWVKIMAWYDNEWGFSNRMLDNALALQAVENAQFDNENIVVESIAAC
jgi:glyceraldehyde-3-phosphate dehydrogenase/erythrose-4-phosphate dehydrogenase